MVAQSGSQPVTSQAKQSAAVAVLPVVKRHRLQGWKLDFLDLIIGSLDGAIDPFDRTYRLNSFDS